MVNETKERTFVYSSSNAFVMGSLGTLAFIQDWNFTPNMDDFEIDRIDSGAPIFTKKSDIVGFFDFNTKNTIDIYNTTGTAAGTSDFSGYILSIAAGTPQSVTFTVTITAAGDGNTTTTGKIVYTFVGRIMSVNVTQVRETGVQEAIVEGEITSITSVKRTDGTT